jgi:hypothetical protein
MGQNLIPIEQEDIQVSRNNSELPCSLGESQDLHQKTAYLRNQRRPTNSHCVSMTDEGKNIQSLNLASFSLAYPAHLS